LPFGKFSGARRLTDPREQRAAACLACEAGSCGLDPSNAAPELFGATTGIARGDRYPAVTGGSDLDVSIVPSFSDVAQLVRPWASILVEGFGRVTTRRQSVSSRATRADRCGGSRDQDNVRPARGQLINGRPDEIAVKVLWRRGSSGAVIRGSVTTPGRAAGATAAGRSFDVIY
jgi:hypothetical protein